MLLPQVANNAKPCVLLEINLPFAWHRWIPHFVKELGIFCAILNSTTDVGGAESKIRGIYYCTLACTAITVPQWRYNRRGLVPAVH